MFQPDIAILYHKRQINGLWLVGLLGEIQISPIKYAISFTLFPLDICVFIPYNSANWHIYKVFGIYEDTDKRL